jgi:DNA-binding GntR family transcriptional regulator
MVVIDRDVDRPLHKQLADLLREQIVSGVLSPGDFLPSEEYLAQTHLLSRTAVRRGVEILVHEGRVTKNKGQRTIVRERPQRKVVSLDSGDAVDTRMPTEAERRTLSIPVGEPVFEVHRRSGKVDLFAGAATTLRAP